MSALLQGNLQAFRLADLLTLLHTGRRTGTLELRSLDREARVCFDAGAVVYAHSNQEPLRLGNILVRSKRITRAELKHVEEKLATVHEKFGRIAIQEKILTEDELRAFLKVQVSEIIYDCFVWSDGEFEFGSLCAIPEYAVTIKIDLPNLIMEGARRIKVLEKCRELLPDSSAVYRVVKNPETEERITLTVDEWKVLFLINGARTLDDLIGDSGEELVNVYRVVYGLLANKLIEQVGEAEKPDDHDTDSGRQKSPEEPALAAGVDADATVRASDRDLLVSPAANLRYRDVLRPTVARLVIRGAENELSYALTDQEYRLGRLRENDIQLKDRAISAVHARIYRGPDGFMIEDLQSRNGIYVNGSRVKSILLQHHDTVRLGGIEMQFHILDENPRTMPPFDVAR
jgi:hypothetical protein